MAHEWKKAARRLRRLAEVEGKRRLVEDVRTRRIAHTTVGDDIREFDRALTAIHRATRGDALTRVQALALEKIVLSKDRQVFEILEDRFSTDLPWIWEAPLEASRARLEASFRGIARIEATPSDLTHEGTGFLVGERLLLTNRHVVDGFVKGVGTAKLAFKSGVHMRCDFKREHGNNVKAVVSVARPVLVHPYWDVALLELADSKTLDLRKPLTLASFPPDDLDAPRDIAVVGYPWYDPGDELDPEQRAENDRLQRQIFREIYGKKRLQPGKTMGKRLTDSDFVDGRLTALGHDASTLQGNSGSPVIALDEGAVVGVHFKGTFFEANYAIPTWELYRDPYMRALGLKFSSTDPAPSPNPRVTAAWNGLK